MKDTSSRKAIGALVDELDKEFKRINRRVKELEAAIELLVVTVPEEQRQKIRRILRS